MCVCVCLCVARQVSKSSAHWPCQCALGQIAPMLPSSKAELVGQYWIATISRLILPERQLSVFRRPWPQTKTKPCKQNTAGEKHKFHLTIVGRVCLAPFCSLESGPHHDLKTEQLGQKARKLAETVQNMSKHLFLTSWQNTSSGYQPIWHRRRATVEGFIGIFHKNCLPTNLRKAKHHASCVKWIFGIGISAW